MTGRGAGWWFAPVAAAAALLAGRRIADPDLFLHVATGRVILETGRLVDVNLFSSTFPAHPWVNPEWLFQVLVAAVHRAGGWTGVVLLQVALVLLLAAVLFFGLAARSGRPAVAACLTLVAVAGVSPRFHGRPQLVSYLLFAVLVLLLDRARRGNRAGLWLVPPLFALWGNVHPELVFGLLALAAEAAGGWLNRRSGDGEGGQGWRAVAIAAAAALPATLLNPEGYEVLAYPFVALLRARGPVDGVVENVVASPAAAPVFWAWLLVCAVMLVVRGRRQDWRETLAAAGFGALAVGWLRNVPYLFLATLPAVQGMLVARVPRSGGGAPRRFALAGALAAAAALSWAGWDLRAGGERPGFGVNESQFPVAAADILAAERWEGRLYNHFSEGSYLVFRLFPAAGVFQDGRVSPYPPEFMARLNARFSPADWPRIVEEYDVRLALVHPWEVHSFFDPREWGILSLEGRFCLLARRGVGNDGLLARREIAVAGFTAPLR